MSKVNQAIHLVKEIEGERYFLSHEGDKNIIHHFEDEHQYGCLIRHSQFHFERHGNLIDTTLNDEGFEKLNKILPAKTCKKIIRHLQEGGDYFKLKEGAMNLFESVLTENLDKKIISHFKSEYMPLWYNFTVDTWESTRNSCSFKWHCDGGPSKHLKIMVYLNAVEEHGGNTYFGTIKATQALKQLGYIFCAVGQRKENIIPLVRAYDIPFKESSFDLGAGDAVIFNPYEVMHRGKQPCQEKTRYVLHMCLVPAPIHWRKAIETIRWPTPDYCDFINIFNLVADASHVSGLKIPSQDDLVLIDPLYEVNTPSYMEYIVNGLFSHSQVAETMINNIRVNSRNETPLNSLKAIFDFCKQHFNKQIDWSKPVDPRLISFLQDVATYEKDAIEHSHVYQEKNKPRPEAIFWPDPDHKRHPQKINGILPYVEQQLALDKDSAIGSAGSCFAFEISKQLQMQGFNYIVTERADDPNLGVWVDGYESGDYARFCANYGILFNTPSFKQLAEKAFQKKKFYKLLSKEGNNLYMDPYRENVYFNSPEAYLNDYNKHLKAVREAFLACEVFIITLGLNECWQFKTDNTVMSRNPKHSMYHLLQPKVLTVAENVENLQCFLDIVREYNPQFKVIVSLSPVPFLATTQAKDKHVITANCHSKSVLRVAAEEFVVQNEGVYYFPSFELVTQCIEQAWERDNRHVKPQAVKQVMRLFKEMFVAKQDR